MTYILRFLLLMMTFLTGCVAHFPVNPRLSDEPQTSTYYLDQQRGIDRSDELMVVLAFSGGGMRASALSYGVLKKMEATSIALDGKQRSLIDEVDLISAVSGGSFTAAYFGLKGYRIFDDFEEKFLRRDIESTLVYRLFNPMRWPQLSTPYYDRSEMAADFYDEILFDGAVFADLADRPGPALLINATDLTLGRGFSFYQDQFDWICSDISRFPVSRAVTASSAVPGLFSAVTLFNYGGQCKDRSPLWMRTSQWRKQPDLKPIGSKILAYQDSASRPYIHLMDGGLADNLGLRAVMEKVLLDGGAARALSRQALRNTQKILVIVVNAAAAPSTSINQYKNPPTAFFSIDAATTVQINLYNDETIRRFLENVQRWKQEISQQRCGAAQCDDAIDFYFVNVSLADLMDVGERQFLQQIPTTLSLTDEQVERLVLAADVLLTNSGEFQRFIRENQNGLDH